jgi:limonene-1,2-epoxide hydrolase
MTTDRRGEAGIVNPIDLVTEFCHCLAAGDMAATCSYLTEDVVYHNMPWAPVVGHAAVRKVLDPLAHGPGHALRRMEISHTAGAGNVVMNARMETWERRGVRVELPVAGLFVVREGRIARWSDYWDLATVQPLLDTFKD